MSIRVARLSPRDAFILDTFIEKHADEWLDHCSNQTVAPPDVAEGNRLSEKIRTTLAQAFEPGLQSLEDI